MDSLTYFNNEQLLVDIFTNKYLGKKESTPIDSYKRCANKFWEVESQYLEIEKEKQIITYKPMSYDWILNAFLRQIICLSGSVLSNLGNKDYIGSLSNCFAQNAPHDSYAGILEKDEALVQLMKRRGGVGMPIHTLRPENAKVNNAAKTSTGAVSFMDRYSSTTNEVAQNGRRGALLLMMMVNHPDIIKFVTKKQDLTKVTGANISVGITNDFMEAVINDSDYFLKWPIDIELTNDIITEELVYNKLYEKDGIYCAKVKAKEIWNTIITCAHNTGEPGIIFVDNHLNYSLDTLYSEYKGIVTNPCGEIWMSGDETCRLIHINISKFVINPYTNEAVFDYKRFYDYCYNMMKLVDNLVDLEIEAISKIIDSIVENYNPVQERELALWKRIKTKTIASRRAGAGSLGWADTLAMLGLPYDNSEDSLTCINSIGRVKLNAEFDASMDRADAHGAFKDCDVDMEWNSGNGFMENTIKWIYSKEQWRPRRNVSISTIAPTGTISQLAQASSGLEPVFEIAYIRNVKCEDDATDFDFQDDVGRRFKSYKVYHPPVKDFFKVNPTATEKDIPWISANNVNYRDRIIIQSVLQKYTSHSISSTINLPNNATIEQVGEIYMEAWKANLKGLTVYRDGCRTGILVTENQSHKKNVPMDRPKELKAFFHSVRVNGIKYGVMVGLLNDLPYEIFAVKTDIKTREIEGKLVKVNKDRYDFIGGNIHIENINTTSQEEKAITLLSSIALRNGAPRKEILKTIEKISANVTDFGAAIGRILKKYSFNDGESESCPNCGGKIIYENGCKTCRECGYSGCS